QRLARDFPRRFRAEIAPGFRREAEQGAQEDLTKLDDAALLARLEHWVRRTLVEFARDSLKPTALAALGLAALEQKLAPVMGLETAPALARDLVIARPIRSSPPTANCFNRSPSPSSVSTRSSNTSRPPSPPSWSAVSPPAAAG